jgi:hypothetical protein
MRLAVSPNERHNVLIYRNVPADDGINRTGRTAPAPSNRPVNPARRASRVRQTRRAIRAARRANR